MVNGTSKVELESVAVRKPFSAIKSYVYALRPHQWVKNLFVLLPLIFSNKFTDFDAGIASLFAFLCFCGIASSVYIFNDLIDLKADKVHPTKRLRSLKMSLVSNYLFVLIAKWNSLMRANGYFGR